MAKAPQVRLRGRMAANARTRRRRRLRRATAGLTLTVLMLAAVLVMTKRSWTVTPSNDVQVTSALNDGQNIETAGGQAPEQFREGIQEAALREKKPRKEKPSAVVPPLEPVSPEDQARRNRLMDRLVAAYPEALTGHTDNEVIWRDGTRMTFDDGAKKDFEARLANSDIEDQFAQAYPPGPMLLDPEENFDPGRFRNDAFFAHMYGDCRKHEVEKKLVDVVWLPKHGGKTIKVTSVNGVAEKLQAVSNELDALPAEFMQYLQPIAGTYNCRVIADTDRASSHSYATAIDLNTKFSDYWQWQKGRYAYRNRVPWEIAAIFEKHGFIWGAKWYHYDSMHFEYRPEMFTGDDPAPDTDAPVPMPERQARNLD